MLLLAFFTSVPLFATPCPIPQFSEKNLQVIEIYDGDTIKLADGRKVRFAGINTTEMSHGTGEPEPFAKEATAYLKDLIGKRTVNLVIGIESRDHYNRLLAHVYLKDGTLLQEKLLEAGLATAIFYPPNIRYATCYLAIEQKARLAQLNLWSLPELQPQKAENITRNTHGYRFTKGKVSDIYTHNDAVWIKFTPVYALKINKAYQGYFDEKFLNRLKNEPFTARGFVSSHHGRARLALRHPLQIQFSNE